METKKMTDYQKMYAVLCSAVDDAITQLRSKFGKSEEADKLEKAMNEAENIYINTSDYSEADGNNGI